MTTEPCCHPDCKESATWEAVPTKSLYMESYACDDHLVVAVALADGLPPQDVIVRPYGVEQPAVADGGSR